jgi:spermidine synthase
MQTKARRLSAAFFFFSGAAALIYEVVWARLLGLVFGNTTFAISTVLSAYMAGLGLGSFFIGRLADHWKRPIRAYGFLEIGIGFYAAATPLFMMLIQFCYVHFARTFNPDFAGLTAARLILSFLIVFVPTFFMGGTLPVLAKFFARQSDSVGTNIAFLYGLNTIGAVCGTVSAGFFLLPSMGVTLTLVVAVIMNVGIGMLALVLSTEAEQDAASLSGATSAMNAPRTATQKWLLAAMAISGFPGRACSPPAWAARPTPSQPCSPPSYLVWARVAWLGKDACSNALRRLRISAGFR